MGTPIANPDSDLACSRCDIPLLERQAVWADEDTVYCAGCAVHLEQMAIAEDKDTEERIGESGKPGGGL